MTETIINADTSDWISIFGANVNNWTTARNSGVSDIGSYLYAGIDYGSGYWQFKRAIIKFDTSIIGDDKVTSVYLKMAINAEYIASGSCIIDVVNPTHISLPTWMADPNSYEDNIYDAILAGTYLNKWQTLSSSPTLNSYLTSEDLGGTFINGAGDTWIGILSNKDRVNSYIATRQDIRIYAPTSSTYKPQLIVNHSKAGGGLMFWFT